MPGIGIGIGIGIGVTPTPPTFEPPPGFAFLVRASDGAYYIDRDGNYLIRPL